MTRLKRFGFFDSVSLDQREIQLKQLIGNPVPEKAKILAYLQSGEQLMLVAGIARDPINPNHPIIGSPHVLTDGAWAWSADVSYYVEKYDLSLPNEFLERMKKNGWRIPMPIDLDLVEF